jgi:hypothetical protein
MKKLFTLLAFLAFFGFDATAQSVTRLIGASSQEDSLWVLDTADFSVVRNLAPFPSSGGPITGINGIATNTATGQIFVIVKQSAVTGRVLGVLNPLTGEVTIVGNTGDNFASITFNGNNTLLGVTGDGANVPETVYRINQANASTTLLCTLGNGADGEAICYNPFDNMVYHWSGNGTVVYEKFDTSGVTVTGITSTPATAEILGTCYWSNNKFLTSDIDGEFRQYQANGTVGAPYGNPTVDYIRGTTLLTCSRAINGTASFCFGDSTLLTAGSLNGVNYEWFFNGVSVANGPSASYYATQPGHYNVITNDACGIDSSGTGVNIVRFALPVVNVSSTQTHLCPNDSVLLNGVSGGTLQWYLNGNPINGATNSTYTAIAPGYYNQSKTNSNGCTDSASTGIMIVAASAPIVNLGNDTATCGTAVTLDAGNPGAFYVWCNGATTQTITLAVSASCAVVVTDTNGCVNSDTITVIVNQAPVVTLTTPDDSLCPAQPAVTLTGSPLGGTLSGPGIAGNMFTPFNAGPGTHTAIYMYTDPNGCSGSDSLDMFVFPLVNVGISASDFSVCIDDADVLLTGTPQGGFFNGTGVNGTVFEPNVAGTGTFTVLYIITDVNGCNFGAATGITVSACVGIEEQADVNAVSVYPNPSNGNVQIAVNENSDVIVFNSLGENVMQVRLAVGTHSLDMTGFAQGIYMIRTQNANGIFTTRMIIQN